MLAYLMGARIGCIAADLSPPPVNSPSGQPGQVIAIDPDGPFWVTTGDGRPLRVSRYQIEVYVYTTDRLDRLIEAFGLSLPVRLSQIPFPDGRDATVWERGIRASNAPATEWSREPVVHGEKHPTQRLIDLNRPWVRSLFALLGITGGSALDVGCGDGWAMSLFQECGLQTSGFDVAPQSLRIARRYLPDAHLAELNYYVAGDHYTALHRTFNFIFCRSIGAAQKQIDWFEPSFLAATRGLADILETDGFLYWQQHSDRTGQIGRDDGFANTPLATVLAHFELAGLRPLLASVYGGIYALVLVRHDFPAQRRAAIEASQRGAWQAAMARFRRETRQVIRFSTVVVGPENAILDSYRAAIGHLSTLFSAAIPDERHRLIIVGTDAVARLYARAAATMHVRVICFWGLDPSIHAIDGISVEPIGWQPADSIDAPTAIVIAEPSLRAAALVMPLVVRQLDLTVDPTASEHFIESARIYLFSGDQDHNLAPAMRDHLTGVAEWRDDINASVRIHPGGGQSVFSHGSVMPYENEALLGASIDDRENRGTHIFNFDDLPWKVNGKGSIVRSQEGIGMVALARRNIDLSVRETRLISRFTFQAWVRRQSGKASDCRVEILLDNQEFRLSIGIADISLETVERTTLWRRPVVRPLQNWHGSTVEWHHIRCVLEPSRAALTIDGQLIGSAPVRRTGRASAGVSQTWRSVRIGLGIWDNSMADTEIWWRDISIACTTPD